MGTKVHRTRRVKKRLGAVSGGRFWRIPLGSVLLVLVMSVSALASGQAIVDDLLGVSFPNAREGWVCGRWGVIYHSADGGKTWLPQTTGIEETLVSVFFFDSKNGWAVGDAGAVIHTKDGGKSWARQKAPVPKYYLMDVFFVSPTKGWIVTEKTHILATDNGGETWTVQFKDQDFILKAVSFSDPDNGWAVGEYGFTYHTTDGGAHWKLQAGSFGMDDMTGEVRAGNYLFGIAAVDAKRAWAVGIDGTVMKTADGGKTWNTVAVGAGRAPFSSVAADRSGTAVVIAGAEGLWVSTDEGKVWTRPSFQPPLGYKWFYRVAHRGDSRFTVVGMDGGIYQNGGTSPSSAWQQVGK